MGYSMWMLHGIRIALIGSIGLLAGLGCPFALAGDATPTAWPIRFDRKPLVGEESRIEMSGARLCTSIYTWQGYEPAQTEESEQMHVIFDAKVLELDSDGDISWERATIRTWTKTLKDQTKKEVLKPGTVIDVRAGPSGPTYMVDRKTASDEMRQNLESIIYLVPQKMKYGMDDSVGSDVPHKVGDTWSIRPAGILRGYRARGARMDAARASGTVHLAGVESIGGVKCLKLEIKFNVKGFHLPASSSQPAGYSIKNRLLSNEMTLFVSADGRGFKPRASVMAIDRYSTSGVEGSKHFVADYVDRNAMETRVLSTKPRSAIAPATTRTSALDR